MRIPEFVTRNAVKSVVLSSLAISMMSATGSLAATTANSSLPGGATSLQETYQSWQVTCVAKDGANRCALSQQQREKKNNQLVLNAEFGPEQKDGTLAGAFVLPFGLAVQSGITLQVDDKPGTPTFPFRTCLPVGCIVPVTFDKAMVTSLRGGTVLKLTATSSEGDKPIQLSIALDGFSQGLERINILSAK